MLSGYYKNDWKIIIINKNLKIKRLFGINLICEKSLNDQWSILIEKLYLKKNFDNSLLYVLELKNLFVYFVHQWINELDIKLIWNLFEYPC